MLLSTGITTEEDNTMNLRVTARDSGTPQLQSSASLILTIQDQNEDVPRFERSVYEIEVNEHLPLGMYLFMLTFCFVIKKYVFIAIYSATYPYRNHKDLLLCLECCLRHASVERPGFESCCCPLTTMPLCHKCAATCLKTESKLAQ